MTKQLFLNELAAALHSLPREERYRTLGYYDELIDDRMEDGQSEEDAVASLGEPQQVAREILGEEEPAPLHQQGPEGVAHRPAGAGLPPVGQPAAGGGHCAAVRVHLPVPAGLCAGGAGPGCLASALVGVVGTPVLMLDVGLLTGGLPAGLFQLGLSVALLGLAVLSALGFYFTGRATVKAAKAIWRGIRRSFSKKGRVVA